MRLSDPMVSALVRLAEGEKESGGWAATNTLEALLRRGLVVRYWDWGTRMKTLRPLWRLTAEGMAALERMGPWPQSGGSTEQG